MEEVKDKANKILNNPDKAWKKLSEDPIKTIHGPGGGLFITDHHHGAFAWLMAGHPEVVCQIVSGPSFQSIAKFWSELRTARLVRLADADGKPISPEQLPRNLSSLGDDPYRSLAWRLRKTDAFCRTLMPQKEFAEFTWADWLRTRPELSVSTLRSSTTSLIGTARSLVMLPEAKNVPGYVGDKPPGFECPDDE